MKDGRFNTSNDPTFARRGKKNSILKIDKRFENLKLESLKNIRYQDISKNANSSDKKGEKKTEFNSEFIDNKTINSNLDFSPNIVSSETDSLFGIESSTDVLSGEESKRLAVLGCHWSLITASDLFFVFSLYLSKRGSLINVFVYPTSFGLEEKEKELHGTILKELNSLDPESVSLDDDSYDSNLTKKLLEYELNKTRYFFAVLEFDRIDSAVFIYDNLDGVETNFTLKGLDLRFIPDEHPTYNMNYPRKCDSFANKDTMKLYKPSFEFSSILKHTKLDCSWDTDNKSSRLKKLSKLFIIKDISDEDLKDLMDVEIDYDDTVNPDDSFQDIHEIELPSCCKLPVTQNNDTNLISNYSRNLLFENNSENDIIELRNMNLAKKKSTLNTFNHREAKKDTINRVGITESLTCEGDNPGKEDNHKEKFNKCKINTNLKETSASNLEARKCYKKIKSENNKTNNVLSLSNQLLKDERFTNMTTNSDFIIDPTHKHFKKTDFYVNLLKSKRIHKRNKT